MDLQNSIIKTLKYSAIFNFPLTDKEVYKYLISNNTVSYSNVADALNNMVVSKQISMFSKYYCLNEKCKNSAKNRKKSQILCKKLTKTAKKDLKVIKNLPFVKFIGLTGSVAAKNAKKADDVDLLIITSPNFLWLTRLFVVVFLKIKGIYKKPYCPNIYLNLDKLTWPSKNIYVANEVVRVVPLYNKNSTYELFLQKNTWVVSYLANFKLYLPKYNIKYNKTFISRLFFPLDFVLYKMQYLFMRSKITTENVNFNFIHFLKNDYTSHILKNTKS